jgi:hypothetical protein
LPRELGAFTGERASWPIGWSHYGGQIEISPRDVLILPLG